jgi:hypothetical protein
MRNAERAVRCGAVLHSAFFILHCESALVSRSQQVGLLVLSCALVVYVLARLFLR